MENRTIGRGTLLSIVRKNAGEEKIILYVYTYIYISYKIYIFLNEEKWAECWVKTRYSQVFL